VFRGESSRIVEEDEGSRSMFSNTRGLFNGGDGSARHPPAKLRQPNCGFARGSSGVISDGRPPVDRRDLHSCEYTEYGEH